MANNYPGLCFKHHHCDALAPWSLLSASTTCALVCNHITSIHSKLWLWWPTNDHHGPAALHPPFLWLYNLLFTVRSFSVGDPGVSRGLNRGRNWGLFVATLQHRCSQSSSWRTISAFGINRQLTSKKNVQQIFHIKNRILYEHSGKTSTEKKRFLSSIARIP